MRRAGAVLAAVVVSVLAVVPCAGCAVSVADETAPARAGTPVAVGRSTETVTVDGITRTFHLYRPARLGPGPVPLVVVLHGGFGSGSQAEASYGWDAEADRGRFLVAYPDGLNRAWNAGGGCCGRPAATGVNDVGFITAMVRALGRQLPLDHRRLYATGISNGGIMAYHLACTTNLFAAIGPDSATMLGPCPHPSPVSVMHIHGTADTRVPYWGGPGQGAGHIDGPSVPADNAFWRRVDRCQPPRVTTAGVVTTSVARCPDGRAVELITIAGAGHQWPGGVSRPLVQRLLGLDPPSTALAATPTLWAFFAAHPRPAN